jgi:ABC-type Fe3+-hydroxamate transport system substrate-binding protein
MIQSVDQLNRPVVLHQNPLRIVSLVPSITELLFDLGLRDEVIAITKFCIHPDEWYRSKTRIGGTKQLDIDHIRHLNPDLIIANKEENDPGQVSILMNDFPVWVSDIHNLAEANFMIEKLSSLLNQETNGKKIISDINNEFKKLENFKKKIKTTYLIWNDPLMTVGGDTFISDIMFRAGFENVFNSQNRYPVITLNNLQMKQCEVILLSSEPYPYKEKHIEFFEKELPDSKIFLADGEIFSWYGSRMMKAPAYLIELRKKIESAL